MIISQLSAFLFTNTEYKRIDSSYCNRQQIINRVQVLPNEGLYSDYCLYITEKAVSSAPQNLMLINNAEVPEVSYNLIRISTEKDLQSLLRLLNDILEDAKDQDAAKQTLTEAFLSDKGLQHLTNVASQLFGNPFWIIDMNFNFLSRPTREFVDDPNILEEIDLGFVSTRTVADLKERHILEQIQKSGKPFRYTVKAEETHEIIACPIRIKASTVGYLQLFDSLHPYRDTDGELMEHAARLISLELQKPDYFQNSRGVLYSFFIDNLLEKKLHSIAMVRDRLRVLGLTLGNTFQILVVELGQQSRSGQEISAIAQQLQYILKDAIYLIRERQIIFLLNHQDKEQLSADEEKELIRELSLNDLHASLTGPFTDVLQCADFYVLACRCTDCGHQFFPDRFLYPFRSIYPALFSELIRPVIPDQALASGCLQKLHDYDMEHSTELCLSLFFYLKYMMNIQKASEKLCVHPNTLRYRIEKMKEITDFTFDDGDGVMELLTACHQMFPDKLF